jgi:hypothetical protein
MWIRTQDKERLLQVGNFSLTRNYGGKKKFAVVGTIIVNSLFGSQEVLALYNTKSEAIQELDRIQKYLGSNDKETYQIS